MQTCLKNKLVWKQVRPLVLLHLDGQGELGLRGDWGPLKGAGYSDSLRKTTEELSGMGTSRHPKVLQSGPNHGCQWIFKLKMSRRHKTAPMAQKLP